MTVFKYVWHLSALVFVAIFLPVWSTNATVFNDDFSASEASVTPQIAGGRVHAIALKSDGTVWAWGYNAYGQLGDGTTAWSRPTPVQVSGLSGVTAIAAGGYHTIALKSDGTVWTWGANGNGQLGDGTTTERKTPVQVSGLSSVTAIAAGSSHTIALKSDGTVWTWGANGSGQLGDGTNTERTTPVQVSGLSGVTAISGGESHTITLKSDGTVWTWGANASGQLGDGTYTSRTTPLQVKDLNLHVSVTPTPTPAITPTPSSTPGGKGSISGDVVDTEGEPIDAAKISLKGKKTKRLKTASDEDGYFEFTNLKADTYKLIARKKGYKISRQTIPLKAGEVRDDIELEMEEK